MRKIRFIQIIVLCCCMGYFSFRGNIAAVIMTSTFILVPYLEERRCEMSYKNNEGYPAPTEGEAIRRASRMPTHIYNDYCLLNNIAGRLGLEVAVIREKKTGKEWPQRR